MKNSANNQLGPCLEHCYKENGLYILLLILFSIVIGIIIGINLGIMIKSKGVALDFNGIFRRPSK